MPENSPRVLVVEDDTFVGMETARLAGQSGCVVVGPVGRLADAFSAAEATELQGAILDIDLGAERVWPLAEWLERRSVPFIFVSGYSYTEVPERYWQIPLLAKPLDPATLRRVLVHADIIGS